MRGPLLFWNALDCGSAVRFGRSYRFQFGLQEVSTAPSCCCFLKVKAAAPQPHSKAHYSGGITHVPSLYRENSTNNLALI